MREVEAHWLCARLLDLGPALASPIANIGSSTAEFREVKKPHIQHALFGPLADAGFAVQHIDIKAADGVDLVGDLNDAAFVADLLGRGFRSVICSNLLEHVADRQAIVDICRRVINDDGHILITVPHSYPYHADPIDTGYRPDIADLATLFAGAQCVAGEVLNGGWLVAQATEVIKGDASAQKEAVAATKAQMSQILVQEYQAQLILAAMKDVGVKKNGTVISQLRTQLTKKDAGN